MLVWLGICAVVAFAATLLAAFHAVSPAPTFHIVFAAGAMPLIFGAILHFVPVLTRSSHPPRAIRYLPLAVQAAGVATPLALAGLLPQWSLHVAASTAALAALILLVWTTRRLRSAFGAPHPGARWYGAALLCLFLAVTLVPVWLSLPELRPALRLFHLHLNTLGFIGLAALGTLPVLLPTTLGHPDPQAGVRLHHDLLWAIAGAILIAAGSAATALWLALPGAVLLAATAARSLHAWQRCFGLRALLGAGATASLAAATTGFLLLLLAGAAHGLGWLPARPSLAAFVSVFLLPLVTGALSHLLPVWRFPGVATARRAALALHLARWGGVRVLLFATGGILLLFDQAAGLYCAGAGLALFVMALLHAFWLDSAKGSDDNPAPVQ
jgi:hypothetical protein